MRLAALLLMLGAAFLAVSSWVRQRLAVAAPAVMPQFGWGGEDGSSRSWWVQITAGDLLAAVPFVVGVAILASRDANLALALLVVAFTAVSIGLEVRRMLRTWEGARERLQPSPPETVFRRYLRAVAAVVIAGSLGWFLLLTAAGLLLAAFLG